MLIDNDIFFGLVMGLIIGSVATSLLFLIVSVIRL